MLPTRQTIDFDDDIDSIRWSLGDVYDLDLPDSLEDLFEEDWRAVEGLLEDAGEHDAVLNHLRHLTVSSLSGYQEIAQLATNGKLKSFAEVISRQRSAQQQSLYENIQYLSAGEDDEHPERLSTFRSIWLCAIWNLEQDNYAAFLQQVEHAEAFLEEAYLTAAASLHGDPLEAELRDYAVMVCGARAICEELADDYSDEIRETSR